MIHIKFRACDSSLNTAARQLDSSQVKKILARHKSAHNSASNMLLIIVKYLLYKLCKFAPTNTFNRPIGVKTELPRLTHHLHKFSSVKEHD